MMSWQLFLCVLLLLNTIKTVVAYHEALNHEHNAILSEELVTSSSCPQRCSCKMNDTHHIITVDCSNKGLMTVPELPDTTINLSLRNNSISNITCESFMLLRSLEVLDLARNKISRLLPCVFQSQSGSLVKLRTSYNNIEYLDVKLFQGLSRLEILDLSRNLIKYLASKIFSDLARLVVLNLSFNHIHEIAPDAFKGLFCLKTLLLQNNHLDNSFHKDIFQDLGALDTLDVKGNEGRLDQAVSALSNLTHLYMVVNTYDPDWVFATGFRQLKNLQVLHLGSAFFGKQGRYKSLAHCFIRHISSNFFENIKTDKDLEVNMSPCGLKDINRNAFRPLSTLVILDLSNNQLLNFDCRFEEWIESLSYTKLTFIDLSFTSPQSVFKRYLSDKCFKNLAKTNVTTLVLRNNQLSGIDAYQYFPTKIEKLDVRDNSIPLYFLYEVYATSIFQNVRLKELYANNQIFGKKTKQVSLRASDTIKTLLGDSNSSDNHVIRRDAAQSATVLSPLPVSVFLNGTNATNTSWEDNLHSEGAVRSRSRSRSMYENEFLDVFKYEQICPEILQGGDLNITIICLPTDLEAIYANSSIDQPMSVPHIRVLNNTVLRHVELADNPLTTWLGPVENVPSLKFLDLSRTQCVNVSVLFFKHMVSLEILILTENAMGPSLTADVSGITFSTLTNLRMLNISQNSIKDLGRLAFIHNTNLETLDISHNRLSEFQPTISTIRNMSYLDLSDNLLPGLSEQTCKELKLLKSRNTNFSINLLDNPLLFTCSYLPFLELVFSRPHIFFSTDLLWFKHDIENETKLYNKQVIHDFPLLSRQCLAQRFFIFILVTFFVVVGTVGISAALYPKRWKLRYLYYIGQRRMHIGEHIVDYIPDADVFITYDQDDFHWRRFMQRTFLPGLNQRNITYILGETDFPGGDLMAHVTGAVVGTRKTVILLSSDIFDDHHREFDMNLAIMREMDTRSLKIVPIFVEEVDLALYPREIELFLRNQCQRCLNYDSPDFWDDFVDAVKEDN